MDGLRPAQRLRSSRASVQCLWHASLPHASAALGPAPGRDRRRAGVRGLVRRGLGHGLTDPVAVSWLNTQIDRACVDVNEFGWLIGWVMECQEKGYITKEQLGGLEVSWGDAEAANQLLQMIIHRQDFGDLLAEGVKRASERLGGPAADCAIYTMKGDYAAWP